MSLLGQGRRFLRSRGPYVLLCGLLMGSGLLVPSRVVGQRAAPPDSAPNIDLPVTEVRASRPAFFGAGARFTTLDSAALQPTGTLADALALGTPLYLKQYGPGQLASLSIRGTSARHVAVLWHGFNINFPSLGEADFSLLPTAGFGGAVVQHGPAAARYGTGAVGGAVVLTEPATTPAGLRLDAQLTGGSFGLRAGQASADFRAGRVSLHVSGLHSQAVNNFPYQTLDFRGPTTRRQVNAAFRQQSLSQDLTVRLGARTELLAAVWLTRADRRIQPGISAANDHARQLDDSQRLLLGLTHRRARTTAAARVAWLADGINYASDRVTGSDARSRSLQAQAEMSWQPATHLSLQFGTEAQHFRALIADYGRPLTRENRFSGFLLARYEPTARLRLSLNARQAVLPGRRPPFTPTVGAEWQAWAGPHGQFWLKGNVARSYRVPTLNERYWQPGGNPNLRPETSLGYEAGLRYERGTALLRTEVELTAYRLGVDDWVQWTPAGNGGLWSPRNLRRVRTQGLELSTQLTWRQGAYGLTARAAYALTQARKVSGYALDPDPTGGQLPYVPPHSANLGVQQTWHGWQLGTGVSLTSYRFTSASATEYLPGYGLLQASVAYTRHLGRYGLTAQVQGFNLTNTRYQTMADRAMPPRAVQTSLRLTWH